MKIFLENLDPLVINCIVKLITSEFTKLLLHNKQWLCISVGFQLPTLKTINYIAQKG
jgi:hypothetical protein